MSETKRAEINKKRREERWKKEDETKKQNLSFASKGLDCDGKKVEPEDKDKITKENMMQCGFCKEIFHLSSIMKHTGNREECKLFYGDCEIIDKQKQNFCM